MASTGSKRLAVIAGKIPDISPISAAINVPKTMFFKDKINSKSPEKTEAIKEAIHTKNNPINPPIIASIIASNRN
jgi:hypothetical protein